MRNRLAEYIRNLGKAIRGSGIVFKSFGGAHGLGGFGGGSGTGDKYKSYAYACINARAENAAKAKIYLYNKNHSTGDAEEVREHPFLELISKPNRKNQTFKEILHKISTSLDLYGNAYLYIHRGIRKKPIGFYFLPSKNVTLKLNSERTEIESYEYFTEGKKSVYGAGDVIHFMIPNPDSNIEGKSTVSAFNYTLDVDYYQNLYQRNYYPNDVDIIPARKMTREEIMAIFRVPKTILGLTDDVNNKLIHIQTEI